MCISIKDKTTLDEIIKYIRSKYTKLDYPNILEDIELSIESYGIRVLWSDMGAFPNKKRESIRGYITERNNVPEIVINGNIGKLEQRYTIAYLFGVLYLTQDWEEYGLVEDKYYHIKDESEEDILTYFALNLLVKEDFYKELKELLTKHNIDSKQELTRILKVSIRALGKLEGYYKESNN